MASQCHGLHEGMAEWATPRQLEVLNAVLEHGGIRAACRATGWAYTGVNDRAAALRRKAAMHGFSPDHGMTRSVPDPYIVRGNSNLYDKDGKLLLSWVKTKLDDSKVEGMIRAAISALSEDAPRESATPAPSKPRAADLCNVYTLTDCHVGMLSWPQETGAAWDLQIAESALTRTFDYLVESSPPASVGIVSELGDFLHLDGLSAVTPQHGHLLDADGRFSKVVGVAVRILRAIIRKALAHHDRVIVLIAEGNHDLASSVWMRHLFGLLYEHEPRVSVVDCERPYYVVQHGETMLAFHHGHLSKNDSLPGIFAALYAREWGASTRRYCHTGHRHHVSEREHAGMTVIQHPTLAAPDAYAARGGWISDRTIKSITYHKTRGEVWRVVACPESIT